MSKQSAIILILVVFLGALGALIYFYFSFNSQPQTLSPITNLDTYDPFGTRGGDNTMATTEMPSNVIEENPVSLTTVSKLRQVSAEPVSGFTIRKNPQTQKTNINYILRANGNIYETYTDSVELRRLSITTVPKVYESIWLPDGVRLIIRYLREETEKIDTFSVKINPATTTLNEFTGGIDGNHLPENIDGLAINPAGDKLFYLVDNLDGSFGFVSKPDGLNKKLIFESPLIEWIVSWPKEEIITMNTKASANIPGYLYFLNSQTGNFSKIIGGINGLTTKTNLGATEILYSDSTEGTPKLYLFDVKKGESKPLPWNTLPEKCTWSKIDSKIIYCAVPKNFPTGDYPDLWYQGLVNFTDDIWLMNIETGAATLVIDLAKDANQIMDISDMQLDKTDNYLVFTNKIDLTLWSLDLK